MTPQPALQSGPAENPNLTPHLTMEQFGELLTRSATQAPDDSPSADVALAEAHLLTCKFCAAELAGLRESLSLFRDAGSAYADNQLRSLPQRSLPQARPALQPVYLAAAAAILVASILPLQRLHRRSAAPQTTAAVSSANRASETDEALLQSVSSEISESVPTPMQALADPNTNVETSVQNSTQRKD